MTNQEGNSLVSCRLRGFVGYPNPSTLFHLVNTVLRRGVHRSQWGQSCASECFHTKRRRSCREANNSMSGSQEERYAKRATHITFVIAQIGTNGDARNSLFNYDRTSE